MKQPWPHQETNVDVSDETIVQYLLGELSAGEQDELERRYFADPALLDRIDAAEDDLIDDYVREALTPERRKRFETHFLTEKRIERVRMAEALLRRETGFRPSVAPAEAFAPSRPWALPLAAALFMAALLTIVWLALENRTLRTRNATLVAERDRVAAQLAEATRKNAEPPPAPSRRELAPPVPPPIQVATLVLSPGLTRGDTPPTLVLKHDVNAVRLEALLEVDTARCDAILQRVGGPDVWKATALTARDGKLVLTIPRDRFRAGEHLLTVTAPDFIADYAFTVR